MRPNPVLVVHGIGNRSARTFAQTVAGLQGAIGAAHKLFDFYWGDLGGISDGLADTLPALWPPYTGRHETRASGSAASDVIAARALAGRPGSGPLLEVRAGEDVRRQIEQAVAGSTWLRGLEDIEALHAVGDILHDVLGQPVVSATGEPGLGAAFRTGGDAEVRASRTNLISRIVGSIDDLIGRLSGGIGGTFNQLLRGKLAVPIALTLGDIVGYHQNRRLIHERLFARLDAQAEGWGSAERPIDVMAHSLGGLLVLDAALGAELDRRLHVRKLVTFGSQPAFFHVMAPRKGIAPYVPPNGKVRLPQGSVVSWTNLWHPLDALAFLAASVFELPGGARPEDLEVRTPASEIIERDGWLHSVYWRDPLLARQWQG